MDFYEANSQQECDMINKFIKPAEIAFIVRIMCVCVCVCNKKHRTITMASPVR